MRVAAALLVAATGCGGASTPADANEASFDRKALLTHLVDHVYLPIYATFATEAAELTTALDAMCPTVGEPGESAMQAAAQAAWRSAIDAWQAADALLVGPAAMDVHALRDRIYAWPLQSTCAVDQDVMLRWNDPSGYDVAQRLNNRRSLVAVEYLLFTPTLAHTCPAQAAPLGWDALSEIDKHRARCQLAHAIASDVAAQGVILHDAWRADAGNYRGQLLEAGTSASAIPSQQEAVNRITDGLFYVDRFVKDMKLGEAAGIVMNSCSTVQQPCMAEVEHRFADHGKQAILDNWRALREVFTGTASTDRPGDGPGVDDFLIAVSAGDVADRMVRELDAAITAAEAIEGSLLGALASNYDGVVASYDAAKAFTDDLKSQFLTTLGLDVPDDVATDND